MKKIWIDTDIGSDCDDAGALAIANLAFTHHRCQILGVTHTTTCPDGPALVDIINRFYRHPEIPLGSNQTGHFLDDHCYRSFAEEVFKSYSSPYLAEAHPEVAVSLMRRVLSKNNDVTLICIGQLVNLARLLSSSGDAFSPLSGQELVKRSCSEIVIMGGSFLSEGEHVDYHGQPYRQEYNIVCDIPSAQTAISLLPVPTVFVAYEIGYHVFSGGQLVKEHTQDNPVALAYATYAKGPRESWDLIATDYGIYGVQDLYFLSKWGSIAVTAQGDTLFKENEEGKCRLLKLKASEAAVGMHLDYLLENKQ